MTRARFVSLRHSRSKHIRLSTWAYHPSPNDVYTVHNQPANQSTETKSYRLFVFILIKNVHFSFVFAHECAFCERKRRMIWTRQTSTCISKHKIWLEKLWKSIDEMRIWQKKKKKSVRKIVKSWREIMVGGKKRNQRTCVFEWLIFFLSG